MSTLEELEDARFKALSAVRNVELEIALHPDTISTAFARAVVDFGDKIKPIIDQVQAVMPVKGITDSRKNMMSWRGYHFLIKDVPQNYETRIGSNWCLQFFDLTGPAFVIREELRHNPTEMTAEELIDLPLPKAVALLLHFADFC